jgi:hypothetical protein
MKKKCPLLRKPCIQHDCEFWVHLIGMDPQTGAEKDEWDCTWRWIPTMLIEATREEKMVAAAVTDMRNLIHRGLTQKLTEEDMAIEWESDGLNINPRLNGGKRNGSD